MTSFEERHPSLKGRLFFIPAEAMCLFNPEIRGEVLCSAVDVDATQIDKEIVRKAIDECSRMLVDDDCCVNAIQRLQKDLLKELGL